MIGGNFPSGREAGFYLLRDSVIANERVEKKADESAGGSIF